MAFIPDGPLTLSGGCFCKKNKYTIKIPPLEDRIFVPGAIDTPIGLETDGNLKSVPTRFPLVDIDHCNSCRRASGAIAQCWFICPTSWVTWDLVTTASPLSIYLSSDLEIPESKEHPVNNNASSAAPPLGDTTSITKETPGMLCNVPAILAIGPPNPQQECEGKKLTALALSQPEIQEKISLTQFRSSPMVTRTFCSQCGTNLTYYRDRPGSAPFPPIVDITVGSLDAESIELIRPDRQCWWDEGVDWVKQLLRKGDGGFLIRHPGGDIGLEVTD